MHEHTQQLCDALDQLNRRPTWHEASRLGIELVDYDDEGGSLHLANGDIVYSTDDGWAVLEQARTGRLVRSGGESRVHDPGVDATTVVHPTAFIDPTARVEAGPSSAHAYTSASTPTSAEAPTSKPQPSSAQEHLSVPEPRYDAAVTSARAQLSALAATSAQPLASKQARNFYRARCSQLSMRLIQRADSAVVEPTAVVRVLEPDRRYERLVARLDGYGEGQATDAVSPTGT